MAKLLTLLVVLMLCCCLVPADAFSGGCRCTRSVRKHIAVRHIKQIEMIRISGHCRRPETILTRRNGSKICIDPNQLWFKELLSEFGRINKSNVTQNSTTDPGNF